MNGLATARLGNTARLRLGGAKQKSLRSLPHPINLPPLGAADGRCRGKNFFYDIDLIGEPVGIRTRDLLIKSQLLYRLSYGLFRGNLK